MTVRIALPVLLFVVACRPEPSSSSPTTSSPAVDAHAQTSPPIPAGHGVLVRPGATVWLDAAQKQPLALPADLVGGGIQLRVIADRGETLEVDVETVAACTSPIVGDFALRLFVARADLRAATSMPVKDVLPDGKHVVVQPGAPVDGAAGARTVAIELEDGSARVKVLDAGVADHFVASPDTNACIDVLDHGKPVELLTAGRAEATPVGARSRFVDVGAKVYWNDGREAGKVAYQHEFHAEPTIAGARTCFPLRLAEGNTTTLCFDNGSVLEGNALGTAPIGKKPSSGTGSTNPPRVKQAVATVKGALDKDVIRRIVRAHINEIRHCYNQALKTDPGEKGRVAVQFAIGPTGDVIATDIVETSVTSTELPKCMATAIKRWKFPKPEGGGNVVVTYPFILEPG